MNLEDNLLIGLSESLFSRLRKPEEPEETAEEDAGTPAPSEAASGGLTLPGLDPIGSSAGAKNGTKVLAKAKTEASKAPFSISLGGLFSALLHHRKEKDKIAQEVQAIDEQLTNVLQESEEINVLGLPRQISAADAPVSQGRGMRELDLEMGELRPPGDFIRPEELELEPPVTDAASANPDMPPASAEGASAAKKKADKAQKLLEPEQAKMPDIHGDEKKDVGDDLLSDLEQASKQEDDIDMSIMKEYQDMPITCVELEADLRSILDQISINAQNKRNSRM